MMAKYSEPLTITISPEPLAEIIREAQVSAVAQIQEGGRTAKGVRLTTSIPDAVVVPVSRFHIAMVLTNLIKNGIEAHAVSATEMSKGYVSVDAQILDGDVVVTVADAGRGIAPADLTKLREFIPGASSKRKKQGSGTGYGLPICRRYVEAHGGTFTIHSKEGEGSRVIFRLPLNTNHNSQP